MSSMLRCAGRLMMRPGRYSTGYADLPAIDNAREVLVSLYKRQIEVCSTYTGEKHFNNSVIGMARHHLAVLERNPCDWDAEYEINMGPLEKLISVAEDQLELIDVVNNEFKPTANFNKDAAAAAARDSSDPFFGQDDVKRTLVFHPVPAGVPSMAELGPFPSIPYAGWPYVPPPKGWKFGDGHRRDNWEAAAEAWVEALNTPKQKLVVKFMNENTPDERKAIAAAVDEAAKLALAHYSYPNAATAPEGHAEAVQASKDAAIDIERDRAVYLNRLYDATVAQLKAERPDFDPNVAPVKELSEDDKALLSTKVGQATAKLVESFNIPPPAQPIKF